MDNYILIENLIAADILSSTHKLCKRSYYLLMQHEQLLEQVLDTTSFVIGPLKETLRERIFVILQNVTSIPTCIVCGRPVPFRKDGTSIGYPEACGFSCAMKNPNRVKRRIDTSLNKYGTRLPQQHPVVKEKALTTCMSKYGRSHKNQIHISDDAMEKLQSKDWLEDQHHNQHRTLSQISDELLVDNTTLQRHLSKHGLDTKHFYTSTSEREIADFLRAHVNNIITNDRTIIQPLELDIVLPDQNIAIEYCGLYWHSEQQGKDKYYHQRKLQQCIANNIRLLTIFSDEWEQHSDIIKTKLLSILQCDTNPSIYARKCTIVSVPINIKHQFYDNNHIQGNGPGSINIGLEYEGRLVACMSFIQQQNNQYILNRFATNCKVVGGFSKLLNYFKNNYEWEEIVSFADLRWSAGELYQKTGFILDKTIPPDYYYSSDGHTRVHKFNYRRKYLPQLLVEFDPMESERTNCDNNNILRIWDCGKLRYVMRR